MGHRMRRVAEAAQPAPHGARAILTGKHPLSARDRAACPTVRRCPTPAPHPQQKPRPEARPPGPGPSQPPLPWGPDLPLASASADMIGWSRVLLSRTLDAARSY